MDLQIEVQPQFLHVTLTGHFSLTEAKQKFVDLIDAVRPHNANRVLVDGQTLTGKLTIAERFDYAAFAAETARELSQRTRFAYLLQEPLLDPQRLDELVATNRGMNVRAFSDFDATIRWLLS